MTAACATIIGIVLQLVGTAYLVLQSWRTSRHISKFPTEVTYDSLGPKIDALARELRSQFFQQALGFLFVLVGAAFLLYGAAVA